MPDLKAVIFDMDGLMIDSEHLQSKAFEKILKKFNIKPVYTKSGIIQTIGIGANVNLEKLKVKHSIQAPLSELLDLKDEIYFDLLSKGVAAMPGLHNLIASLKKTEIKIAVASSSNSRDVNKALETIKVRDDFLVVVSGDDVKKHKPAPDLFLRAAKLLDASPGNCIVLEDAESGIKAAKAAQMTVVAVPNQFSEDQDFTLADHIINSLEDLSVPKLKELLA